MSFYLFRPEEKKFIWGELSPHYYKRSNENDFTQEGLRLVNKLRFRVDELRIVTIHLETKPSRLRPLEAADLKKTVAIGQVEVYDKPTFDSQPRRLILGKHGKKLTLGGFLNRLFSYWGVFDDDLSDQGYMLEVQEFYNNHVFFGCLVPMIIDGTKSYRMILSSDKESGKKNFFCK